VYAERVAEISLRYFDCRGRAEPIRHLLRDRGVAFEDVREPIDDVRRSIAELGKNPGLAAPYGLLPVLDWDGFRVTQTLPIANFVARELGLHSGFASRALARLEGIASAAYCELTSSLPDIVWSPLWCKNEPFEAVLERVSRLPSSFPRRLEPVLAERDAWFGGADPAPADFFVFEGLSAWCALLGEPYLEAIRKQPKLFAWWGRARERVHSASLQETPFTASPFEAQLFARAREFVKLDGSPWPL
jgi:hypothetical protein